MLCTTIRACNKPSRQVRVSSLPCFTARALLLNLRPACKTPATMPMSAALKTLKIAKGVPRKALLTKTESIPVRGYRPSLRLTHQMPSRFMPMPAGMTPQEHRGSGTPINTDVNTPFTLTRRRRMKSAGRRHADNPPPPTPTKATARAQPIPPSSDVGNSPVIQALRLSKGTRVKNDPASIA